jgi:Zn-dependent protease
VLIGEPPPSPGDLHFRVFGIPVRVHPFFWVVAVLLGLQGSEENPVGLLIWVGAVFVSILIHELGHALAALSYGWRPWITLYGFGGLASFRPTYRDARSQIIISAAGPGAGFMFIALVMSIVHASGHGVYVYRATVLPYWISYEWFGGDVPNNLDLLVNDLLYINVFWGIVNLLPVYPLDGGQISRELFVRWNPRDGVQQSLWLSVFTGAGLAIFGLVSLGSFFMALFFGYMAYSSFAMLQMQSGRGGGFGGRGGW